MGEVGDLDVSKLQGELHELNRQRVQVGPVCPGKLIMPSTTCE